MKILLVDLKAQYKTIKPEIDSVIQKILDDTSFIMGEPVKSFENNLANFCNCKYAIGVSSGTSALYLALKAAGIKKGDEVITVPNSFIATPETIIHCGAKPVFVEIEDKTMLMDPSRIEKLITPNTKAIVPVHLYGQVCDMDQIMEIAKKYNLIVIEDAAQAIDAEYKNKKLPIGDMATFSFFPAKNLGCYGDGGAVITNNEQYAKIVSKLRDHGRFSKYESDIVGFGERLDALQAAILNVKLYHLKSWTEKRQNNAKLYDQLLSDIPQIKIPYKEQYSRHVYYMYEIMIDKRDELMNFLKSNNIFTGIHYPVPLHLQPALKNLGYKKGDFEITEKVAKKILSLPMYPELKKEQIELVCNKIKEFLKKNK